MSENAAARANFVSHIYNNGISNSKEKVLQLLPSEYSNLHNDGYIHIHDLEAYGKVYNCSMPKYKEYILSLENQCKSNAGKIDFIFSNLKLIISKIAVSQTGGIGFNDFDCNLSEIFESYKINFCDNNAEVVSDHLMNFLQWINENNERYCREPYYLTFNMGLSTTEWGRFISKSFIDSFYNSTPLFTRPNIVFKVSKEINSTQDSKNYDIYQLALKCTAKKMIPTYLLLDSKVNKNCDKYNLGIMGCRTRVYQNINGPEGCLGRGNVANISINLPRIAFESQNIKDFYKNLNQILESVHKILLHRISAMKDEANTYISNVLENHLWGSVGDFNEMEKQGTLSIGFIGLSETVEILTGNKPYYDNDAYLLAIKIVQYMRDYVDKCRTSEKMNYSLLASPGELISGRFCNIDKTKFNHKVLEKEFYTNSFHVEVDSNCSVFQKINIEAPFHLLCNGGAITYIEFNSAPLQNNKSIQDIIDYSTQKGISYLGVNYPLDICKHCKTTGTFDNCPQCGSQDIKRIRRVSGYLEDLSFFTEGKKAEVKYRQANV